MRGKKPSAAGTAARRRRFGSGLTGPAGRKQDIPEQNSRKYRRVTRAMDLALVLLAVAAILLTGVAWRYYRAPRQPKREEAGGVPGGAAESLPTLSETEPESRQMLPSMQKLYEQNSDLAGWVQIPGTAIDYPVMYRPQDYGYYLHRNFAGEEEAAGCIFIDEGASIEPRSTNLLLHGHNMKNGSMFRALTGYEKEAFYQEHPVIRYTTLYEEQEYEIFAVFLSRVFYQDETDVFRYYQFFQADTEEEFAYYVDNCRKLSLYDTGVVPEYGDELLTLTTCEYHTENGRLAVAARRAR